MRREAYEHSHLEDPPEDFARWWHPHSRDRESGADIGGHPDAFRVWARKDPGRWVQRSYGTGARVAWNAQPYRDDYEEWVQLGRPERNAFVSISATLETQKGFWRGLKTHLAQIGKPMTKPLPFDHDPPERAALPF